MSNNELNFVSEKPTLPTVIIGSIVAIVMSIVAFVITSIALQFVFYYIYTWLTLIRPEIALVIAIFLGGSMGMLCAKRICDSVLRSYSRKSVALAFIILAVIGILNEILFQPMQWLQIISYAEFLSPLIFSVAIFWNDYRM